MCCTQNERLNDQQLAATSGGPSLDGMRIKVFDALGAYKAAAIDKGDVASELEARLALQFLGADDMRPIGAISASLIRNLED